MIYVQLGIWLVFMACFAVAYYEDRSARMGGKMKCPPPPAYPPGYKLAADNAWTTNERLQSMCPPGIAILDVAVVTPQSAQRIRWAISLRASNMERTATVFAEADTVANFPYQEIINKIRVFAP